MKAKELQIGDWVICNPNVFIEDEYEPMHKCYSMQINSGEDIDTACEDCYEPIPLTAEILEKNGFIYRDLPFELYWEYDGLFIEGGACGHYVINLGHNRGMDVSNVHELQHALRLCGLKEIADNFKI